MGDPQVLLIGPVVDGGKYVTMVVGAVTKLIPEGAVPPEISFLVPATFRAGLNQLVVNVKAVALFAA